MELTLVHKGKSAAATATTSDELFAAAAAAFDLPPAQHALKILSKGKQLQPGADLSAVGVKPGAKLMVMASARATIDDVQAARSDPTIRGFAAEALTDERRGEGETSVWGTQQDAEYKFCKFCPCTWQSFGTRAGDGVPHAFEARKLLFNVATDPAICHILKQRRWTVGTLAELDPVDDRLSEKMEGGGKRLLGYNTNHGAQIHVRLRTDDLSTFLPYDQVVDTILHELAHNEVGPHNAHFWHLMSQLKVDYLRHMRRISASGTLFGGRSPVELANVKEQVGAVREAVAATVARDSQGTGVGPEFVALLDAYLAADAALQGAEGRTLGGGGAPSGGGEADVRALLADRAEARRKEQGYEKGPE